MDVFRRLMTMALAAGAIAGLLLFALQWVAIGPLIAEAERHEHAAAMAAGGMTHEAGDWQPADGTERTAYTALGTVLTGIAYGALLFGAASLLGLPLAGWRAWALGAAGFACFALAPSIGLPPKPPGAAVPELRAAQLWWIATAAATAIGLWLIAQPAAAAPHGTRARRSAGEVWVRRGIGAALIVAPHVIGAPGIPRAETLPPALVTRFALASVITQGLFWLALGAIGGRLSGRLQRVSAVR